MTSGDGGQPEVDMLRDRIVALVAEREAKVAIAACTRALVVVSRYHGLPRGTLQAIVDASADAADQAGLS